MSDSVSYKSVQAKAEVYNKDLRADDPRFRRAVTIIAEDGSVFNFDSAFLMELSGTGPIGPGWIVCFTEHYGFHVYDKDDLLLYFESERRRKPIEKLP